jgi:methylase of polypeptide subunit release factors
MPKDGGRIYNPFGGGVQMGYIAGACGYSYVASEIRQNQCDANNAICSEFDDVKWVQSDSSNYVPDGEFDMVFSCPPYADLEVYSDDPQDLSNMEWHTFVAAYKRIIFRAVQRMKPDTFACFVVGDFRDKKGFYRNFVSETIDGFEQAGARLYNEAILATSVGSASMRVTKQFESGRKMAKTHQNVLVFCKGDWKKAADKCNGGV